MLRVLCDSIEKQVTVIEERSQKPEEDTAKNDRYLFFDAIAKDPKHSSDSDHRSTSTGPTDETAE
jgi:hypothetical protein